MPVYGNRVPLRCEHERSPGKAQTAVVERAEGAGGVGMRGGGSGGLRTCICNRRRVNAVSMESMESKESILTSGLRTRNLSDKSDLSDLSDSCGTLRAPGRPSATAKRADEAGRAVPTPITIAII